ncbi:MAG: RNA-binding transcriptional accessory protein [Tenericutes bacterium]|nr:RNA-binding transcriptional accessory protein [Mycoplasmatota bacterium]
MNEDIINDIKNELNIKAEQAKTVLKLLEEGNTIPFIARYRKEATGALDEEQIRKISEVYEYQVNLLKRKEDVIRLIDEKGLLTDEIKNNIMNAKKLVEVEDIYAPYKEKKKTKATEAIKNGLEPLAKIIMSFPTTFNDESVKKFLNENVKTVEDAITGAKYIIAEWISDNAYYRKWIRSYFFKNGIITSKVKKKDLDTNKTYEMYYEFSEAVKHIKPHRVLAINRGENEKILSVNIEVNNEEILSYLESKIIKKDSPVKPIVIDAIKDSYKRLIFPSMEREIRSELTSQSEDASIEVFKGNLENLLLIAPMKNKRVLGFDPAFRTGCKLAVVDETSKVLNISVIYPHEPHNKWNEAKETIKDLINKYKIDIIAIGNGTASRESEKLVSETLKEINNCKYAIVSEAGASVYSASKLAIDEFPDLTVEKRSAVSIARRLQDPLNELVKIDPKSIGVGQYQHDVSQKKLSESLDFTVEKCVNNVGVDVNTASPSILKYISGLTKTAIDKIIKYRETNGKIKSREEIKKKKLLSDKAYEQSIGFMRIVDGTNPLDKTNIHTESYDKTIKLLNYLELNTDDLGTEKLVKKLDNINEQEVSKMLDIDLYTLNDIIDSLKRPNRDYRDDYQMPILKSDILTIDNLTPGMKLEGTVRNVVDFGAFIDIGLHNDGLVHISKITNKYIKHPNEVLSVGDIVTCYVIDINKEKEKVSLTLINPIEK